MKKLFNDMDGLLTPAQFPEKGSFDDRAEEFKRRREELRKL
jgi:hypothetical protein